MKEVQAAPEKLIVIDIKLNRGLVVALSCVVVLGALLGFLALTGGRASASEPEAAQPASTGMRQYNLTPTAFYGDQVLGACAAGYHTASFWEIADPSNLEYNTALGATLPDSGQGPPTTWGWVRTGYTSGTANVPGQANCSLWTSRDEFHYGSLAYLPSNWTLGWDDLGVWGLTSFFCSFNYFVWCIED